MIVPGASVLDDDRDRCRKRRRTPPRFNHVAMSVPSDLLDETGPRATSCRFYGDVFGFEELPTMTEDRRRLVFGCYSIEQFVFLIAERRRR